LRILKARMRHGLVCLGMAATLALTAPAQTAAQNEDDKGFITRTLQDALSDAGRRVTITGFVGSLSARARLDELTIADDAGVWLTLRNVELDWTRSALLRGRVEIDRLTAAELIITRPPLPAGEEGLPDPEAEAFAPFQLPDLPVSVDIADFSIENIVLGAEVLGQAVVASLSGAARLEQGSGEARLMAARTDGQMGRFEIRAGYDGSDRDVDLSLVLSEGPGGIAATVLDLPVAPSVGLDVMAKGSADNLPVTLALASDGEDRLTGQVNISASGPPEARSRRVAGRIAGDISPLLAPQFRPFFGSSVSLDIDGARDAGGTTTLSAFELATEQARFGGQITLTPQGWPAQMDITGRIADPSGARIRLPVEGGETFVDLVDLTVRFDADRSNAWSGIFDITGAEADGLRAQQISLVAGGTLMLDQGALGAVDAAALFQGLTADVQMGVTGLAGLALDLERAIGADLAGAARLSYAPGAALDLQGLTLTAGATRLAGRARVGGYADGFPTDLTATLTADDLDRFSGFAGMPLSGRAQADVTGRIAPLAGVFDLELEAAGRDLRVGITQADAILDRSLDISLRARRSAEGTFAEGVSLRTPQLAATGAARLQNESAQVSFNARLRDAARVTTALNGPVDLGGTATSSAGVWRVDTEVTAPSGITARLRGPVTGPEVAVDFEARVADVAAFVADFPGPLTARGRLTQSADTWQATAGLTGPSGSTAQLAGRVAGAGGPDLRATGRFPLGLAAPLIAPRQVLGDANFDLRLADGFDIASVSGEITTTGARLSLPRLKNGLEQIALSVTLAQGRAAITGRANVAQGGAVSLSGSAGFTGAMLADLRADLSRAGLRDPGLYQTDLSGQVAVTGSLRAAPRVSGVLTLGETNVTVPSSGITSLGEVPAITHLGAAPQVIATQRRAGLLRDAAETGGSAQSSVAVALDLQLRAPGRIFVRGRGLDAELGGALRLTGTTANIVSVGGFDLIRGRLDILQKRFDLSDGAIQFQGSLVPRLMFIASTPTDEGSARVILEGTADAPDVRFEAEPSAPEDDVLAQLLFGRSIQQIMPLQAVQLGNAVALLAGQGGVDIIGTLRSRFALDDLDLTSDETGGAELRVGKYISDNVYTDVTVGAEGKSKVSINIDLSPNLTLKGSTSTSGNSALGLFFEKDY
jgi:translocation and assembly module TamB